VLQSIPTFDITFVGHAMGDVARDPDSASGPWLAEH
jgi:hypothetical protein